MKHKATGSRRAIHRSGFRASSLLLCAVVITGCGNGTPSAGSAVETPLVEPSEGSPGKTPTDEPSQWPPPEIGAAELAVLEALEDMEGPPAAARFDPDLGGIIVTVYSLGATVEPAVLSEYEKAAEGVSGGDVVVVVTDEDLPDEY